MLNTERKKVVIVDSQDNVIGAEQVSVAIEKSLIRRAARVYVFNNSGQLLIQQRSNNISMPLMLDQSAAGHVDEGETYHEAAARELFEELGLENIVLEEIEVSYPMKGFFNGLFRAIIPDNTLINFSKDEVNDVFWYDIDNLNKKFLEEPEKFALPFRLLWPDIRVKIIP